MKLLHLGDAVWFGSVVGCSWVRELQRVAVAGGLLKHQKLDSVGAQVTITQDPL